MENVCSQPPLQWITSLSASWHLTRHDLVHIAQDAHTLQAAVPVEAPAAQLETGAAPMEEDAVPSAVEDLSINQLTAGEVSTSAAAENVVAAAVEKAVDASALLFHLMHSQVV